MASAPIRTVGVARMCRSAACDEGDDDVGGVAVEVLASPVVDGCGAWVGVAGSDLDVAQRDTGVERSHDERRSEHVRVDVAKPGTLTDRTHPPVRGAPVEALPIATVQDRAVVAFTDGQIDGSCVRGTGGILAGWLPLPTMPRSRCPRSNPRSSTLVAHASLTRRPLRPSSTASAAWARSNCSAVNRNTPSSERSSPRASLGWTCGRRTCWAGLALMRPSMCAKRWKPQTVDSRRSIVDAAYSCL